MEYSNRLQICQGEFLQHLRKFSMTHHPSFILPLVRGGRVEEPDSRWGCPVILPCSGASPASWQGRQMAVLCELCPAVTGREPESDHPALALRRPLRQVAPAGHRSISISISTTVGDDTKLSHVTSPAKNVTLENH